MWCTSDCCALCAPAICTNIRISECFALFILMFWHVMKSSGHLRASTNDLWFMTFVHQKMSARISGHSIIYDSSSSYCSIARSGWHLPLCGVAVVSQVLCTSTTLNKRNTVSVQSPYNGFWIVTTFFMLFYLCDICITRIYKDIPRKLFRQGQSGYFIYFS